MTVVDIGVPVIVFLLMTAVGMDLTPTQLLQLRRHPLCVWVGVLAPVVLLPMLALALVRWVRPEPDIAGGLLLVAACPIGGISNTYSYLAGASAGLSVLLTTISSVLAVATIPAISWGFAQVLGDPMELAAPPTLLLNLVLLILLPVAFGMWARARWPIVTSTARPAVQRAAFVALGLLLVLVLGTDPEAFRRDFPNAAPLSIAFVVASFAIGWVVATLIRASEPDRFTLAVEFATRNVAIATAIAVTLLDRPAFAIFASIYFLTELPIMLAAIAWFRMSGRREMSPGN